MMKRIKQTVLCLLLAACLLSSALIARADSPRGDGDGARAMLDAIDSIELTLSPSFGLEEDLIDITAIIRPAQQSVAFGGELFTAPREDFDDLVSSLNGHDFFSMPESFETGVLDGHFTWVTVILRSGESKRAGGLVAEEFGPEEYIAICEAIDVVLQNRTAYPNWPGDADQPEASREDGTSLLTFCGAERVMERIAADPPSLASVCLYTVAGETPFVTEAEGTVRRVAEALREMVVFEAYGSGHTDDYLEYTIEWEDGTKFSATFQTGMLLGGRMELYPVTGFDALLLALQPMTAH